MLFRMARLFVCCCLLLGSFVAGHADTGCSPQAQHSAATEAARLRKQLLAMKVEFGDGIMHRPELLQKFKVSLGLTARAVFACHDTSTSPTTIQNELARLLHANLPGPAERLITIDDTERPISGVIGDSLKVRVTRGSTSPLVFGVSFYFGFDCGDDNVLLLFETQGSTWKEAIRWQAQNIFSTDHAFGDFFLWSILPGEGSTWRVVVAHGSPWCTSRFSGFQIDVLEPASAPNAPKVVWHKDQGYSRFNAIPRLHSVGNTFELRLNADALDLEEFERPVIYRYKMTGNQAIRIQPTAVNARGFVEEWLSMPWDEAKDQSDPAALETMHAIYKRFQRPIKEADLSFITDSSGPVRACAVAKQFQVEIKTKKETFVRGVAGGHTEALPSTYFRVVETDNGYQLLSAEPSPDTSCNGRDLMPAGRW